MSSNLITGFHTRLEGSRKFLFGNALVYGKANDSIIRGYYMIRGNSTFTFSPFGRRYEDETLTFSLLFSIFTSFSPVSSPF